MTTKKIIVPTDFSSSAFAAAQYACKLAAQKKFSIHLFHCYTTSSANFEGEEESSNILKADVLIAELKDKLILQFPSLTIETECVTGLLTEVLPVIAAKPEYCLIVMGTTGNGQGKSLTWGSNTSSISSKAPIPVIAIPENHSSFESANIAMLTNFKVEEIETLKEYLELVSPIQNLDIIHVFRNSKNQFEVQSTTDAWKFNIQDIKGINAVNSIIQPIQPNDEALDTIPEVINHIINKNNYDMILVTKSRKSFFERLFSSSVSKKIVLDLERPTFFDNN